MAILNAVPNSVLHGARHSCRFTVRIEGKVGRDRLIDAVREEGGVRRNLPAFAIRLEDSLSRNPNISVVPIVERAETRAPLDDKRARFSIGIEDTSGFFLTLPPILSSAHGIGAASPSVLVA